MAWSKEAIKFMLTMVICAWIAAIGILGLILFMHVIKLVPTILV